MWYGEVLSFSHVRNSIMATSQVNGDIQRISVVHCDVGARVGYCWLLAQIISYHAQFKVRAAWIWMSSYIYRTSIAIHVHVTKI